MGLAITYTVKLSANHNLTDARAIIESLRQHCLDLPFASVGKLSEFEERDIGQMTDPAEEEQHPILVQQLTYAKCLGLYPDEPRLMHVFWFTAWPGQGAETFSIGLGKYENLSSHWWWTSSCKTQFANDPRLGGKNHFLLCHLTTIAALDRAQKLGLEVEVLDEGGFWTSRDVNELIRKVQELDRAMAAFGGALKDRQIEVESDIFGRPGFERLEAEGMEKFSEQVQQLVELIQLEKSILSGNAENEQAKPG